MWTQVKLRQGTFWTYGWTKLKVRKGQKVTMKEQNSYTDGVWVVEEVYNKLKISTPPQNDWKVGGLK